MSAGTTGDFPHPGRGPTGNRLLLQRQSGDDFEAGDVTLIACLHPNQCRTLLADTLIVSPKPPKDDNFVLPTRIYIPQIREMQFKPVALRRKIVEINSNLVALWSGDYNEAYRFAERAATWFEGRAVEENDLKEFLSAHYRLHVPDFHAIVAPADQGWLYRLGDVDLSYSHFAGDYAVSGTGKQLFRKMVDPALPRAVSVGIESGFPRGSERPSLGGRFGFWKAPCPSHIRQICGCVWLKRSTREPRDTRRRSASV